MQAWSDPIAHLAARRRAQDPGRRRRRADVHRGRGCCSSGSRAELDPATAHGHERRRRRHRGGRRRPSRPVEARLAALQSPELAAVLAAHPLRELVTVEGPYPLYADRPARAVRQLVRVLPALRGRDRATRRPARSPAAPSAPPPSGSTPSPTMGFDVIYLPPIHPIGEVNRKGPNNTLDPGPDDTGLAVGDRLARTAATTRSTPTSAPSRTSTPSWPRAGEPRARGGARPGAAVRARPPVGDRATPSGSPPAPTAPSPTPRTRPRSTRTSTRSTSTTTRPASAARCSASSGTGCPTACGSSGSTTRTPSRWRSGSGCCARSAAPTPTCCSWPRRSPGRR